MADEQDIGGWVETDGGVEWDIDGVVERDAGETGTWCWGHDSEVDEDNVGDFADGSGTAAVAGTGDDEAICITSGEDWISPAINIGTLSVQISYDKYQSGSGDAGIIEYRTGADQSSCEAASWSVYSVPFNSLGWAQTRFSVE